MLAVAMTISREGKKHNKLCVSVQFNISGPEISPTPNQGCSVQLHPLFSLNGNSRPQKRVMNTEQVLTSQQVLTPGPELRSSCDLLFKSRCKVVILH